MLRESFRKGDPRAGTEQHELPWKENTDLYGRVGGGLVCTAKKEERKKERPLLG